MSTGVLGRAVGVRLRSVTGRSGPVLTSGDPKSFGWEHFRYAQAAYE